MAGRLIVNRAIAGLNSGTVMARMRNPKELKVHPELAKIFTVDSAIVKTISESMKKDGYDPAEPIVMWEEEDVVVDGHQRRESAILAEIDEVSTTYKSFATLSDAKLYCWKRQSERRNLTQAELFEAASLLNIKTERDGTGRSSEKLAKELGVSASTIQHARAIAAKADETTIEAVKKGEKSINEAYESVRQKKVAKESDEEKNSLSDELAEQRRSPTTLGENPFEDLANDPFDEVHEITESVDETLYRKVKKYELSDLAQFLHQVQSEPLKSACEWEHELKKTK